MTAAARPDKKRQGATRRRTGARDRIVQASVQLFQAKGYHGAGLAEILALAAAPKGSMYHHFPGGKEELALAALAWLAQEVDAFLDTRREAGDGGTQMALGMAEYCASAIENAHGMRGSLISVLAQDAVPASPRIKSALDEIIAGWTQRLADGFAHDGAADPPASATRALALLEGAMILGRIKGDPQQVTQIVAEGLSESS